MSSIYEEIAKNIRFQRKRKGLTQRDLAKELGITASAICNYESGYTIDIDTLYRICRILECKVSDMYGTFGIDNSSDYTLKEQNIIKAYRNHPDMQAAVDKLLDISADQEQS